MIEQMYVDHLLTDTDNRTFYQALCDAIEVLMQSSQELSTKVEPYFTPITDVVYIPEKWVGEFTTLTPVQNNIFITMNLAFCFSLILSTIRDPATRKMFSTPLGLFL